MAGATCKGYWPQPSEQPDIDMASSCRSLMARAVCKNSFKRPQPDMHDYSTNLQQLHQTATLATNQYQLRWMRGPDQQLPAVGPGLASATSKSQGSNVEVVGGTWLPGHCLVASVERSHLQHSILGFSQAIAAVGRWPQEVLGLSHLQLGLCWPSQPSNCSQT